MEKKYDNYIYELEAKVKAERKKHPVRWMWWDLRNWYYIMIIRAKVFLRKLI